MTDRLAGTFPVDTQPGFDWLGIAFTALGAQVSWLEAAAFSLALACVVLTVLEKHWGWPLAILSSVLYALLFQSFRLYGEAVLQLFFVGIAVWGWWQWLYGHRPNGADPSPSRGIRIARLTALARFGLLLAWLIAWCLIGILLGRTTDSDVPWFDAFPTAGSVLGQVLLARKYVETWAVWIIVNLASVALFAYKELMLTAVLYLAFATLALIGHLRWQRSLAGR